MGEGDYQDLILRVGREPPGRHRLSLTGGEGGATAEAVVAAPGDAEPWLQRAQQAQSLDDLGRLGRELYGLLFPAGLGELLRQHLERLGSSGRLRLQLRLPPDWAALPWEYVCLDGPDYAGDAGFLALDPRVSLVRMSPQQGELGTLEEALEHAPRQRKVLVALASPAEGGWEELDLERELGHIERGLAEVWGYALEPLRQPSLEALERELEAPADVLHFAGHGDFRDDAGYVVLVGPQGQPQPVQARTLALTLRHRKVRLVVLSACHSARPARRYPWGGVAAGLVGAGVPAVVAMQSVFSDAAALIFSRELYAGLAEGRVLDEALTQARRALYRAHATQEGVRPGEWGVPVLHLALARSLRLEVPGGVVLRELAAGEYVAYAREPVGAGEEAARWQALLPPKALPYKRLSPYGLRDRVLFAGREREAAELLELLRQRPVVLLQGGEGVGKTSLAAAGIAPVFVDEGWAVLQVQNYMESRQGLRDLLAEAARQAGLPFEGEQPAQWAQSLQAWEQKGLLVIFDQLERLLEAPRERRESFWHGLREGLAAAPERLRVLLVARQSELEPLRQGMPDELLAHGYALEPLELEAARQALRAPLELEPFSRVALDGRSFQEALLEDLDALSPAAPGHVMPADLQVVAYRLYQAALGSEDRRMGAELYRQLGGAETIRAGFVGQMLEEYGPEREPVQRLLRRLAAQPVQHWLGREQLLAGEAAEELLESLIRRAVLAQRRTAQGYEYAFASPAVRRAVRRYLSRVAGEGFDVDVQETLERVWEAWLNQPDYLPGPRQLRYLAAEGRELAYTPEQALLLLRAAVAHDENPAPWVEVLRQGQGPALLTALEQPAAPADRLEQARKVLQLPTHYSRTLSQAAVSERRMIARYTAAMALQVPYPQQAVLLGRLEEALDELKGWWRQLWRRAELRGLLADADPEFERQNAKLRPDVQLAIWYWRVKRRLIRDRRPLLWLVLGGALGAAAALALLRVLTGFPNNTLRLGGIVGLVGYFGAIVGALGVLGLALGRVLQLQPLLPRSPPTRMQGFWLLGLGALGFALGQTVVSVFSGLPMERLGQTLALSGLAGLGLSVSLWPFLPGAGPGWRAGLLRWLPPVLAFVAAQWLYLDGPGGLEPYPCGNTLVQVQTPGTQALPLVFTPSDAYVTWAKELCQVGLYALLRWPDGLSLLDAALVGLALAAGLHLSLRWAWPRASRGRPREGR